MKNLGNEVKGNFSDKNLSEPLLESLNRLFLLKEFREGQKKAVESVLSGTDTLVLFPTGGGKSLTYQFPAAIQPEKTCIVVSPLISLMKDQVDALGATGISATFLNSSQDELDSMRSVSRIVTGKIRLVYVSPEKALSDYFLKIISQVKVSLIAIDEAHCISQWGHDFRQEYKNLYKLREICGREVPMIAVTATATERVVSDIQDSLRLKNPVIVKRSFFRENLSFKVEFPDSEFEKDSLVIQYLEKWNMSQSKSGKAIIYCATRKKVEEVYTSLKEQGYKCGKYHAGRSSTARENMQNSYFNGKVNILVATNAFGMGIDHPDIRLVVHYQSPSSIEQYFQEAGRSGRDGNHSECVLFLRNSDIATQRFILQKGSHSEKNFKLLSVVKEYAISTDCRQRFLCSYFGESVRSCGKCDNCKTEQSKTKRDLYIEREAEILESKKIKSSHIFSNEEQSVIKNLFRDYRGVFGKKILTQILKGKKTKDILRRKLEKSVHYGLLKNIPEESILLLFETMLQKNELKLSGKKYPKLYDPDFPPSERKTRLKENRVSNEVISIMREFKNFRDREARKLKWKKFMVFQNAVLKRIAEQKPANMQELLRIKGVGISKAEKFGSGILKILEKF